MMVVKLSSSKTLKTLNAGLWFSVVLVLAQSQTVPRLEHTLTIKSTAWQGRVS